MEGVSLDAQCEKIQAYCKLHEVELIGIYKDEGLSTKSMERPGLKSALSMMESGLAPPALAALPPLNLTAQYSHGEPSRLTHGIFC